MSSDRTFGISQRILALRNADGKSQEDLARLLDIPRSAVSQIENGERNVSSQELLRLTKIFSVTSDYLLGLEEAPKIKLPSKNKRKKSTKTDIRISVPQQKLDKFKEVLLYILERCAGKPNVGETVVYKLLYFSDFNFYEMYEEQLTGATYRKLPFGPVPMEFQDIVKDMEEDKQLTVVNDKYYDYSQKRYIPLRKADLHQLKASEKAVLDNVIDQLSDRNASWLSEYSHEDVPWKATSDKDVIDYELVFYRTPPYSVRDYSEDDDS